MASFVCIAGLTILSGLSSAWMASKGAGIVRDLGSRTIPTVTESLTFAQRSSVLAAQAPALATQKDAASLDQQAARLSALLAEQNGRLGKLRGMVASPAMLGGIDRMNTALGDKMRELRALTGKRLALATRIDQKMAVALIVYDHFLGVVQPLVDAAQDTANGLMVSLKQTNAPTAIDTLDRRLADIAIPALRSLMAIQAQGNLTIGMLSAASSVKADAAASIKVRYEQAHTRLKEAIDAYDHIIEVYGGGSNRSRLKAFSSALFVAGSGPDSIFALRDQQTKLETDSAALLQAMTKTSADLGVEVDRLVKAQQEAAGSAVSRSENMTDQSLTINVVLSCVALVVSLLIGWLYVSRVVIRRLKSLAASMGRLAAGDRATEVKTQGRDEIAEMAGAVQIFKTNMLRGDELAAEAAHLAAERETVRQRADAERTASAERQAVVVKGLADGLANLAKGDLTYLLTSPFSGEYEGLRGDFNKAVSQLRSVMEQIVVSTNGLRTGTDEISVAADDLSNRTEQQVATLVQTAAALDEITATVRKSAEGALHARDIVGAAKTNAEHSADVMQQTVEAMSGIERSSAQIGQIITVIDEIAFQTNLLALNAGVEAARAGDSGRGFAVVASEVRALAQRSAEAAREIKKLVSESTRQVDQGVHLVAETGVALKRIFDQVVEINVIVSEIASLSKEQATGLDQVNTAVNRMDQVTQQNAAMVEQTTASSHGLAQDTETLSGLVGRFDVGDTGTRSPLQRAPNQAEKRAVAVTAAGGRRMSSRGR